MNKKNLTTKEDLIADLKKSGIKEGDTVLLRGNIAKLGRMTSRNNIIDAFLEVVGSSGTIVTLSFTKEFPFYKVDKDFIFDKNTESTSGALTKLFLNHSDCIRSTHPTNSFAAIGQDAEYILKDHNEMSLCYTPIKRIIELEGKLFNFGIVNSSPGFTTVHYAQEELGITKKSFLCNLYQVYYRNENKEKVLFKRGDIGGCSKGFANFYRYYLEQKLLQTTTLGKSEVIMINASEAYKIEYDIIKKNNTIHFCNDPLCLSCRVSWRYSLKDIPSYIVLKALDIIKKAVKK